MPPVTAWFVLIAATYPAGRLDFFPAKEGGIEKTYPHQSYNGEGDPKYLWRTGKLCLRTETTALKRFGYEVEPKEPEKRLAWNVRRARQWLECAARNELLAPGDPFELPDFSVAASGRLAFSESVETLKIWSRSECRFGFVRFFALRDADHLWIIAGFEDAKGERAGPEVEWGALLQGRDREPLPGVWVRVDRPVALAPWQPPMTWAELVAQLCEQGVDLEEVLPLLLESRLRSSGKPRLERRRLPLVIGFPIPEVVNGPPMRMHWVAFEMPRLAEGKEAASGFRPNTQGHFRKDLESLRRLVPLPWLQSQSWDDTDLTGRGRLPQRLRDSTMVVIGAGALGSAVAELLIRGGTRSVAVFDGEVFEAGNLVRHCLTLDEVGQNKAEALARRLNKLSPHARVVAAGGAFPNVPEHLEATLRQAVLVFDCSADDSVLFHLEEFKWGRERIFISLSLGLHCRRLYCFTCQGLRFPRQAYVEAITPGVEEDWQGIDESLLPREALGCWHPLMPGGVGDVWMLAASAVKFVGELLEKNEPREQLTIFEQVLDDDQFCGVRRVPAEVAS